MSSCKPFFFFFFFLPQQLESTSLLGDSLPNKPSSSCPPISRDGGSSSSRRYDRFLRVQIQFSTIWWTGRRRRRGGLGWCSYSSDFLNHHDKSYNTINSVRHATLSASVWYTGLLFVALQINFVMEPKGLQLERISGPEQMDFIPRCLSPVQALPHTECQWAYMFDNIKGPSSQGRRSPLYRWATWLFMSFTVHRCMSERSDLLSTATIEKC